MQRKEAYLQQVVEEVEEVAARVAALKAQIAKTPEYPWELRSVRNRFRDFQRSVEELEEAGEENLEVARNASESAWNDLRHAVDELFVRAPGGLPAAGHEGGCHEEDCGLGTPEENRKDASAGG